jgi:hypothetical protein
VVSVDDHRATKNEGFRVLFCIGVTQSFFEEESASLPVILPAIQSAFDDLGGRFGIKVLGTLDDDQTIVGQAPSWPWTAYILADAPDMEAVVAVCNLVRETSIGPHRLWRYLRIEARVGRELFFANS